MPRRSDNLLEILTNVSWWWSLLFSGITYVGMIFVIPLYLPDSPLFAGLSQGMKIIAPFVAIAFLIPLPFSLLNARRKKMQLDTQKDIESIRKLSWRRFEELVGEAYRRQGYRVAENGSSGPDGGVDLVISKDGKKYLVQCKQWRNQKVGVKVVREIFGLLTADGANGAIVISSGSFTDEARDFARGKHLELVDGAGLAAMIAGIQCEPRCVRIAQGNDTKPSAPVSPTCPACGKEMILRTARKGSQAGQKFWGCSGFPKCRTTQTYTGDQ